MTDSTNKDDLEKDDVLILLMPEVLYSLRQEIEHHPKLVQILRPSIPSFKGATASDIPIDELLGHTAAYCGIILEGYYTEKDILNLCNLLVRELKRKPGGSLIEIH